MNKLGTKLGAIAMSAVMALSFAPSAAITSLAADGELDDAVEVGVENVYVVYNPNSGEHLFTTNHDEVIDLLDAGWGEGDVAWVAPTVAGDPVYRIYNPNVFDPAGIPLGDHHYTTDKAEADKAVAAGWKYDNDGEPVFYSADSEDEPSTAIYCAYNPNAYTTPNYSGAHHLTIDEDEYEGLVGIGWTAEGAKFYGYEEGYEPGPVVEELTVSIDNTTPKVGDTLTVTVKPADATVVYQWYADGEAIEGATDDELLVTIDMIGSKISVAVADAKGNKDVSDETAPVAVYEELEILSAEQKGAKTIEATFSEAITGLDKLTVSKNGEELKQAYAAKIADDGLSATITLENRITAGTYTVTLTPANGDDKSEAEFEGEVAALGSIEFVSDYLIMKDNEYKEGYAYIKGYDQFGDEMSLSSVTVIPGYGHFRSYDATTGKITIGVDDDETNFAIVKEVPVFVTYQNGADTIPANATLKVTTMSYVQDLTFGDIYKADGSKVDDDTNPLMIGDLKSKPYVEILDVEDQYGNKLSAKDLNDQATGNTKVLFVIPDESTTSAYYSTGKFSTITEKDGTVKTILYLAAGGDMPGSMDLIITGASGQSFSKPVTVQDDPYIDTLRVNYPTLYEGTDESDALEFTAVDQYGKEIKDLFNFAPKVVGQDLRFNDMNHQTNKFTQITAPAGVNWIVKKDNINKKFTVTMKLNGDVKKGATLVMMATTAGLKVTPTNLTVGQRTNGESIDTTIGGNLNLDPVNNKFDFNKNIRFLSSNGTVMDRVENEQYPIFLGTATNVGTYGLTDITGSAVRATQDKPVFYWTVSVGREGQVTRTAGATTNAINTFIIAPSSATNAFDGNGVIQATELTPGTLNGYQEYKPTTYYVTLYKESYDGKDYNVSVIDKQSFKLTYSPTVVDNEFQLGTQYTASIKENRNVYANDDGTYTGDKVTIQVKAYPNIGEPYLVPANYITVTGSTSDIYNNGLKVYAKKAGTATFSVYVEEPGAKQGVYTTVKVTADDKQTATKVQKDFEATAVAGNVVNSKVGDDFTDSSRTATEWSADAVGTNDVKVANGKMTITNGNRLGETLTLGIKDQHDLNMTDAKFYVDGVEYTTFWKNLNGVAEVGVEKKATTLTDAGKHIIEVRSADDSIIQHYTIDLGEATWYYTAPKTTTTRTVLTEASLRAAIADKVDEITIARDVKLTNTGLAIPANVKVTVQDGYLLDADTQTLELGANSTLVVSGELKTTANVTIGSKATITVNGVWTHTGAATTITNNGLVDGSGHVTVDAQTIANTNGEFNVTGSTLVLTNATSVTGGKIGGHVQVSGANVKLSGVEIEGATEVKEGGQLTIQTASSIDGTLTLEANSKLITTGALTVKGDTTIEVSASADLTGANSLTIPAGATVTVESSNGAVTVVSNSGDTAATGVTLTTTGVSGGTGGKITEDENETKVLEPGIVAWSFNNGSASDLLKALQDNGFKFNGSTFSESNNDFSSADGKLAWAIANGLEQGKYYAMVAETSEGGILLTSVAKQTYTTMQKTSTGYGRADYWTGERKDQVNIDNSKITGYTLYVFDGNAAPTAENLTGWSVDATDSMYHQDPANTNSYLPELGWTIVDHVGA